MPIAYISACPYETEKHRCRDATCRALSAKTKGVDRCSNDSEAHERHRGRPIDSVRLKFTTAPHTLIPDGRHVGPFTLAPVVRAIRGVGRHEHGRLRAARLRASANPTTARSGETASCVEDRVGRWSARTLARPVKARTKARQFSLRRRRSWRCRCRDRRDRDSIRGSFRAKRVAPTAGEPRRRR